MIKIIAAIGKDNELGLKNNLPEWKIASDMQRFRDLTKNSPVIMGRSTFESLPEKFRPLPGRTNVVLTRDSDWSFPGVLVFNNIAEVLNAFKKETTLWVIGGENIYTQFIELADELHITHVEGNFPADKYFPKIDKNIWVETSKETKSADEKDSHPTVYKLYRR